MNCPKCKSKEYVKNGVVNTRQRYKCKRCSLNYTVEHKAGIKPEYKRLALMMYLEGMGLRSIGRIIGVSNVSVLKWIKSFGVKAGELPTKGAPIKEVEIDEMHTYIGSKKTKNGFGWLLIKWDENGYSSYVATEQKIRETNFG